MTDSMRLTPQPDGTVQVRSGKVELGQGILGALSQIVADELGLHPAQVRMLPADTAFGPDEGVTSGSMSVQDAGTALRQACRALRASEQGSPAEAPPAHWVGQAWPRADLVAKLSGQSAYLHDIVLPGLLHGRVLHPPERDALLITADTAPAAAMPGVLQVLHDGRLLGLLAEHPAQADLALQRLAADLRWQSAPAPAVDGADQASAGHDDATTATALVAAHGQAPSAGIARTLRARYRKPWIAHAAIGPSCALAWWQADAADGTLLQVWTHSQGLFNLRRDLALAFGLDLQAVRLRHADGAGCYGHNGADDVAFDAAWLARACPGCPVRLLWSRRDEMTLSPFGPAMTVDMAADLDADGQVLHWRHQVSSPGHSQRPGRSATPALLGSWQTAAAFAMPAAINMPLAVGGGAERNAVPGYRLPAWEVRHQHQADAPLRSSALRSLGALANVFAAESLVDEIAHARGEDPLAWRRRRLAHDARALAVLDQAADLSGWASRAERRSEGVGQGLAFARYKGSGAWCAVVAEVEAAATLRVRRLWIAVDVGAVVNPDGVAAQIEGGAIQATSWALKEAVAHAGSQVLSDAWALYPMLRFSEVPAVEVACLPSSAPSLGAGEASLGPTAAAIANALFDALGLRLRELPLTPERITAAIHALPDAAA